MKRLRESMTEMVLKEREHLTDKFAGRLAKIHRHCEDTAKTREVALMISQISGSIGSLKFMRDENGVAVPFPPPPQGVRASRG